MSIGMAGEGVEGSLDRQRFFIVGCQRSGTTLMRLLLGTHCDVHCFDEATAYVILAGVGPGKVPAETRRVGYKIPRWTGALLDAEVTDFGHPIRATDVYRGESIVFMLRGLLDTVASMVKLRGQSRQSWLLTWGLPTVEYWIGHDARFADSYAREIALVRRAAHPDLAAAALYWRRKTDAYFHYQQLGLPVIGVRYEALVSRPESVLRGVVGHLGLDWDPAVLAHERSDHPQILKAGLATGGTDPTRAIDDRSVDQWRDFIEPSAVDEMLAIADGLVERVAAL
jgi:hypothetical protein